MVYAMICYNISLNIGGMSNQVFLMAFGEMKIMWPVAFVLEFFIVDNLAHKLAFRIVTPKDRPFAITVAISVMIICIMCPIMSLIATILFKNAGSSSLPYGSRPLSWTSRYLLLAAYVLWTADPFSLRENVSGETRCISVPVSSFHINLKDFKRHCRI